MKGVIPLAEEHKKSFLLYLDNYPCVEALTTEQRGQLLLMLYRYAIAEDMAPTDPASLLGEFPDMEDGARMAYLFLAETIRRDTERWKAKQRRYRNAARRRNGEEPVPVDAWDYV